MTVLLITNNYPPVLGGVSRYYAGLVAAAGGRIHVSGIDTPEGFAVRSGLRGRLAEVGQARKVSRAHSGNYAILAGQPHMAVGAMLAGVPFGIILHGGEWQAYPKGQSMLSRLLRRALVIGCNSFATRDQWIAQDLHDRVVVIHPGTPEFVGLREITPSFAESEVSAEFRVLCVSRLSPRKGIDRLIQAVERNVALGRNLRLDIVGEGPGMEPLSNLITMPDRVFLHGKVDDSQLATIYSQADLFVMLPHRIPGGDGWEGYGIVYLEAAAQGLPILAARTGGVVEAVAPSGSILLEEDCTIEDVCDALTALMSDSEARQAMGKANVHWAQSQSWVNRSELVADLVDRLEAGRP